MERYASRKKRWNYKGLKEWPRPWLKPKVARCERVGDNKSGDKVGRTSWGQGQRSLILSWMQCRSQWKSLIREMTSCDLYFLIISAAISRLDRLGKRVEENYYRR